jgi:hypothetical protein
MLLNILRAAHRFPMHFTELSTLSATGTASVGGTLTLPFATLNNGTSTFSAAPTGTVSESPTFNMAVLETQEFYKGMLAPVSASELSTYLEEGLQAELIFTLAFGEILYQHETNGPFEIIENNFHKLKDKNTPFCGQPQLSWDQGLNEYACFRAVLRALVDKGLTIEPTHEVTNLGPLISQASFGDLRWLNGLDPKTLKITAVDQKSCKSNGDACPEGLDGLPQKQKDALTKGLELYRVQKEDSDFRLCFDQPFQQNPSSEEIVPVPPGKNSADLPTIIARSQISAKLICRSRLPEGVKLDRDSSKRDSKSTSGKRLAFYDKGRGNEAFSLQMEPRSTEGMIYFLGEIARCSLRLDSLSLCSIPTIRVPYHKTDDVVFAVSKGDPEPTPAEDRLRVIDVTWSGDRYTVNVDPTAVDRSGQVLRIITQLLALNRSAKDFPAPAVVPIITH